MKIATLTEKDFVHIHFRSSLAMKVALSYFADAQTERLKMLTILHRLGRRFHFSIRPVVL